MTLGFNLRKFLKLLVSLLLLITALHFLDWKNLRLALFKVNPWIFALAVLISLSQFVVMAVRWHHIIRKIVPLPLLEHMKYYFYGTFLNTFTPANIGGDVYRFISLKSSPSNSASIVTALMWERLLGLLSYFLFYLFCLVGLWIADPIVMYDIGKIFIYAGAFILTGTAALFLSLFIFVHIAQWKSIRSLNWLLGIATHLQDAVKLYSFSEITKFMGLSLLALFIWILTVQVVAIDLGLRISLLSLGAIVILVELTRLIPISVQGIGVREGMYAYLFVILGKPPEAGFILGTVSYLALSLSLLFSGFVGWCLMYLCRSERQTLRSTDL